MSSVVYAPPQVEQPPAVTGAAFATKPPPVTGAAHG